MDDHMEPMWDVIVIGAGPSGLMAAIEAGHRGAHTLLIEKGKRPGRKLLISGGGRCNVTNARGIDHIIENTPGNGRFLYSVFRQWSNEDIIAFFMSLGVALKEEDRGRMFPVTDRADTVLDALLQLLDKYQVTVRYNQEVSMITHQDEFSWNIHVQEDIYVTRAIIIATGGCSIPQTGSTGDGYRFAKSIGHTIVEPYPTSVPLMADDLWIKERFLQGVAVRGTLLTAYDEKGKVFAKEEGDLLFTHFGLSGPAALRISQYIVKFLARSAGTHVIVTVDLLPGLSKEEVFSKIQQTTKGNGKKLIRSLLRDFLSERFADVLLFILQIDSQMEGAHLSKKDAEKIASLIKAFPVHVTGTLGLSKATVTGGGVFLKEVDPATLASKKEHGLYFCGEVLDVHAHTGGYNITVAFSTGHVAGNHAAEYAIQTNLAFLLGK